MRWSFSEGGSGQAENSIEKHRSPLLSAISSDFAAFPCDQIKPNKTIANFPITDLGLPTVYRLLAIVYWLLAIGYWLLAIGYWLLAILQPAETVFSTQNPW